MTKQHGRLLIALCLILGGLLILAPLPAYSLDPDQCLLFRGGGQDPEKSDFPVSKIQSVLLSCRAQSASLEMKFATRRLTIRGEAFLLMVDGLSLRTIIARESCWKCEPTTISQIENTRLGAAVVRETKNYRAIASTQALANAGLHHAETPHTGSFLTADLCPSPKSLDKDFIEQAETTSKQKPMPIALSASGAWLRQHKEDLRWIKERVREGKLDVTWVNHSNKHPFKPGIPNEENFLLTPGVDLESEILETERALIMNGVTPSIFFRFPGLISDAQQMDVMKKHMLIPLGADAWLATGQKAEPNSIILVHANGNEPLGKKVFQKLANENRLPLPFLALPEAVRD